MSNQTHLNFFSPRYFFYNHITSSEHRVGVQPVTAVISTDRHSELRNYPPLFSLKKRLHFTVHSCNK